MLNQETSQMSSEQKRQLLAKLLQQKATKQQKFSLSFAQKRLWFLEQLQPGLSVYNLPTALRLTGKLNIPTLEQSFQTIISRHEILRTSFTVLNDEPVQNITTNVSLTLPVIDLQGLSQEVQAAQIIQQATTFAVRPFDLAQTSLLRAVLLLLGEDEYVLLFVMHHIIADYWSLRVLVQELILTYQGQTLPKLAIQYVDFANWQQKWLQSSARTTQLEYWRKQLQDCPCELSLPTDYPRPAVQTFQGARLSFVLSGELSHQLGLLAQKQGATVFMTLLAAFNVLLYRYSGQKDILVGSTVTSRDRAEISNLIGLFVNNLVFRTKLSGNPSFRELLDQVKETTIAALAHQELPFEDLVEQLQPERNLSQNALFQVMFILHNTPNQSIQIPGLVIEPLETQHSTTRFDLSLDMYETPSGLRGSLEYSTDLFQSATIERFVQHFQRLLQGIVENPEQSIAELPILTEREQQQIQGWNDTAVEIPNLWVYDLFAQQVEKTLDKIAVIFQERELTYRELNTKVNQLAGYLQQSGVLFAHAKPQRREGRSGSNTNRFNVTDEVRVGIFCDRSLEMVIALLAVLRVGGAYVPLDPAYPKERLSFILEDAQVSLILTQQKILYLLPSNTAEVVCLDLLDLNSAPAFPVGKQLGLQFSQEQLAYLIYTSGSTGIPKGVQILHKSLVNFLTSMAQTPGLSSEDTLLAVTTLAFDIAALEIFLPLTVGASLVLVERETTLDGVLLAEAIEKHQITVMQATPATWRLLFASGWKGKEDLTILCGGEALEKTLALELLASSKEVWNLYGPTETTIWSAAQKLNHSEPVSIGLPIANTQFYVLDDYMQPVPLGVPGELYIGGAGVARGYWGKPDFPTSHLYKTGDRVRYLENGTLEYLGRLDYQVKIRGYRIELGEIEAVLMQHPDVLQAVVVVRSDISGEQRLIGYVILKTNLVNASHDLRSFLLTKLPGYMIPAVFVVLEKLPLTPNGKVDRKALPAVDASTVMDTAINTSKLRTPTEELLAGIWSGLLGVEVIDVEDNFFDLGGHSLLATRVVSQVRQVFDVELPLRQLFEMPRLTDFARVIEERVQNKNQIMTPAIVPISRSGNLPLSFAQQRFWVLTQLEPDSPFYNIPLAVQIQGNIDIEILQRSFNEIVRQQEILRTRFQNADGHAVLRIDETVYIDVSVIDLEGFAEDEQQKQVEKIALRHSQQAFDLSESLLRVQLLRLNNTNHVLLLTLHHIIADAWSMGLLVRDTAALYRELSQHPESIISNQKSKIQYVDYAHWQREWLQGDILAQHLEYWQQQLADVPALLELPTDYSRPAVQSFRGAVYRFHLSKELTQALKQLSQGHHSTLFMTLLSSLNVLLHRYTSSEDIVVGSPIANRNRTETEALIGCFANTLALRTDLSGNPSFETLLQRVRNTALAAYAHQDLPFEQLVEVLQPTRSLSYSPIFQVMLVLQNLPVTELEMEGIKWQVMESDSGTAKFDLTWTVSETSDGLSCKLEYSTDLFKSETIARLAENLETLLQAIVENPQKNISELSLLSKNEQQLLTTWNQTQREYPTDKCLHELFEEQVEKTSTQTAIIWGKENLSYQELNNKANQLAHYLKELGVKPEVTVGICTDRSLDLVIGLLAILKAGGAYVPLDPNYPSERLALIIEDAQIQAVVSQQQQLTKLPKLNIPLISLDTFNPYNNVETVNLQSLQFASPENCVSPDNLAYIIYTSGTTGIPKGVAIPHRNPVTLMHWAKEVYTAEQLTGVLASTSINFDLSVFEIFVPLSWGGTVILAENALQLPELPAKEQVTLLNTVPTAARELLRVGGIPASVKTVNLAGEALPQTLVQQLYQQPTIDEVINLYGPSEDTTYSTIARIDKNSQQTITIGHPIANTQLYILDENLQRVPIGVPGEIYLGGAGVARGYWQRPKLTSEKFIPNPNCQLPITNSQFPIPLLYKTGDRARYLADGNVEYLGRIDQQIKLRGFRIELGEIETVINQYPAIAQAVAAVRQDVSSERDRLVAYIVPKSNLTVGLQESELRSFLASKLPSYMIPSLFVILSALPLTNNGKVDRRALPNPEWQPDSSSVLPSTVIEQKLATIWSQVLALESVGITDNFFSLGGDSILAIQVVAKANQKGLGLQLRQMFQYQTVAELAGVVENNAVISASQEMVTGDVPLTPIQHWFFEQNLVDSHYWNQAIILEVEQPLNLTWLRQALEKLIIHHDGLRLYFEKSGTEESETAWKQINAADNQKLPLIYIDLAEFPPEAVSSTITFVANELQSSFDLTQPPLLRVAYFHLGEEQSDRLLLIFHHLIIDGISWRILLEDLQLAYQQLSQGEEIQLPFKTTSFQEWSIQLQEYFNSRDLQQPLNYWTSLPWQKVTPLPVDFPEGSNIMADVASYSVTLSYEDTQALLQEISSTYQTQINDVLLTALVLAFQSWTGNDVLPIELEGHGREDLFPNMNFSRTVGWFTSLFAVLLDVSASSDLAVSLKTIKEQLRQVPNRGVSYGLLRYLAPLTVQKQLQAIPSPQVRFNYLGQSDQVFSQLSTSHSSTFKLGHDSIGHSRSPQGNRNILIEINSIVIGGQIRFDWIYSRKLYQHQTIATLAENYQTILCSLIQHCLSVDTDGFTPSDFPQMQLSQDELDDLLANL